MPYRDPVKRREANAERMRKRRAAGTDWPVDPDKEARRKRIWYLWRGGKEKIQDAEKRRKS